MGISVQLQRPDGGTCEGYFAEVPTARAAVVVIQEWWGLNDQVRSVVDYFAQQGFHALAPDLYHGRMASDADEASHLMNHLDFAQATHQDLSAAIQYLKEKTAHVGVTGFCMGGALTIAAGVHLASEIQAVSCFYGIPPAEFADPALIRVPFQGHFADRDAWITPEKVDGLQAALSDAPQDVEIYRYQADHAFVNQTRPEVYEPELARQALERTVAFFRKHLV